MFVETIEDLIEAIASPQHSFDKMSFNDKDRSILFSMASQLSKKNLFLTENQAKLAIKILKGNPAVFTFVTNSTTLLDAPVFKNPFRVIDNQIKVSIEDVNGTTLISIKQVATKEFIDLIGKISAKRIYDSSKRKYFYQLNEKTISEIVDRFNEEWFDTSFCVLADQIKEIKENLSENIPSAHLHNGEIYLKNVNQSVQSYFDSNKKDNLLSNLLLLKIMKIYLDQSVLNYLDAISPNEFTKKILLSDINNFSTLDKNNSYTQTDILKFLTETESYPVLLLMPENPNSHSILEEWASLFSSFGIRQDEISVLFRSDTNKKFNTFIKENKLNNLVDNNTKIVIINYKIPKILYKINFNPRVVITTEYIAAHYTNQKLLENHPLTLCYNNNIGKKVVNL
jgi:hypothetical protein